VSHSSYLLCLMTLRTPRSSLFPYTTLFRSALRREFDNTRTYRRPLALIPGRLHHQLAVELLLPVMAGNQKTQTYAAICLARVARSEEHTSELQSRFDLVCRLLLEKKNTAFS